MTDARLVSYFQRHMIPILFTFAKDDFSQTGVISSFVVSIGDWWFLITAGHCINQIEKNLRQGYEIKKCRLLDSGSIGATHRNSVPFDYTDSIRKSLGEDDFDYGIIHLKNNYVDLLKSNGVEPLDERTWRGQFTDADCYFLLGVPGELVDENDKRVKISSRLYRVTALDEKPDCFDDVSAPAFYGQIHIDDSVSSIKGMSGGPLFAIKKLEDGNFKYCLHGVQSGKGIDTSYISAFLMEPFIKHVADEFKRLYENNNPRK